MSTDSSFTNDRRDLQKKTIINYFYRKLLQAKKERIIKWSTKKETIYWKTYFNLETWWASWTEEEEELEINSVPRKSIKIGIV